MPTFRTILVAGDFSHSSLEAFLLACFLAKKDQSRLLVLHVVEQLAAADGPVYFGQQSVAFSSISRPQECFETLRASMKSIYPPRDSVMPEYVTKEGDPAEEIVEMAQNASCDLIVMGTHGRTGLSRLLTGSVAEVVSRKAGCPVITLRSHSHIQKSRSLNSGADGRAQSDSTSETPSPGVAAPGDSEAPPVRCILHPTDFSDGARAAFGVARSLARELEARLVILHVIPIEGSSIEVPPELLEREPFDQALEALKSSITPVPTGPPVTTMLRDGNPVEATLRTAKEVEADLIVVGTHGRSGLSRLFMGSVAEQILRRSECPVLTVKSSTALADQIPLNAPGCNTTT